MSTPTGPGGYPGQTQGYVDPQGQGFRSGQAGPGVGDRASHVADSVARHVKTPETKEFFKTSEFIVWLLTVVGILIAAAAVSEGQGHAFDAQHAWLYIAVVSAAYIISRGIAKAATRRGYGDAPMDQSGAPFQRGGY